MAKNPLGPIGENVRDNVKRLRQEQNLTLAELARRLSKIGRSIPSLGLSRIENGERRVDADDLVALASVLGVSPAALLLPPVDLGAPVGLVENEEYAVPWERAWRWATGDRPLHEPTDWNFARWASERLQYQLQNRPYLTKEEVQRMTSAELGVKFSQPAPLDENADYSDPDPMEEGDDDGPGG
ncbi:helix-turn-helix transcriptional regulator [Streptomyces sp. ISL-96]|uniref:helix-turn-helix domain-containing protein n=1 Tax=Streptomyces sp. ISL-96 TaxID=2819191 RepID=UPI001BE77A65|nr:helix-turn-helix transcriptional regulator [Streptomyces sp. ISL-96]MBT2491519.1 helix-turn-helix transcriptional regulator [Streptomyces sp. ISL-96]